MQSGGEGELSLLEQGAAGASEKSSVGLVAEC